MSMFKRGEEREGGGESGTEQTGEQERFTLAVCVNLISAAQKPASTEVHKVSLFILSLLFCKPNSLYF